MMYPKKSSPFTRKALSVDVSKRFKRDKIRFLLINRFQTKFNTKKNPQLNNLLYNEIDQLLSSKNVAQSRLSMIERKLANYAKNSNSSSSYALLSHKKIQKPKLKNNINNSVVALPQITKLMFKVEDDPWAKIIYHNTKKYKEEQRDLEMKMQEKKKTIREMLLKQIEEKIQKKKLERQQEVEIENRLKESISRQEELDKNEIKIKFDKIRKEKIIRDQQLREEYERKQRAKTEEQAKEQKRLDELKKQIDTELKEDKKKREQKYKDAAKLIKENERYRNLHIQEEIKQREEDKRILQENIKSMELQEQKRIDEMKAKEARIQALVKYAEVHVVKNEVEKRRQEEQIFLKEILKHEKEKVKEEKNKLKQRKEMEISNLKCLDEQLKDKRVKAEEEKKRNLILADYWKKEEEVYKKEKKEKEEESRLKNKQWFNDVLEQINENKKSKGKYPLMNEQEFLLNKKLMQEISNEKDDYIE